MTETRFDVAIVGAGIVGLATALELTQRRPNLQLVVLDKEGEVAAYQTGNNSGVIHAGIYYKPGSLKAQMSIEGMNSMAAFCETHDLPYELCGAEGLFYVLASPQTWERLHRLGRERILARYTWERTAQGYVDVMQTLVQATTLTEGLSIPAYFTNPSLVDEISIPSLAALYFRGLARGGGGFRSV